MMNTSASKVQHIKEKRVRIPDKMIRNINLIVLFILKLFA